MTDIQIYALLSALGISILSFSGVVALSFQRKVLDKILFLLVSLAVGVFFGDSIIHLIPEAFNLFENTAYASLFIILGIFVFFSLEKILGWQHTHETHMPEHDEKCIHPVGPLVLFSDSIHNAIDGIIIAASFMISTEIGIITTIAIALHEIPQEISDFALLLHAGYSRGKAILFNFVTSFSVVIGVLIAFTAINIIEEILPALIAFAAGGFIYIAGSDLVPELHKKKKISESIQQLVVILIGIGIMFALLFLE